MSDVAAGSKPIDTIRAVACWTASGSTVPNIPSADIGSATGAATGAAGSDIGASAGAASAPEIAPSSCPNALSNSACNSASLICSSGLWLVIP